MESINKRISAAKPSAYDPMNDCFTPLGIYKVSNAERVKLGNKKIDGATIQRLRAEQERK